MAMALNKNLSVLGLKVEGTAGTYSTPAAEDVDTRTYDAALTFDAPVIRVPNQGTTGYAASPSGRKSASLKYWTFLHGNAATGLPDWSDWLPGVGMALTSTTYATSATQSNYRCFSAAHWIDGRKKVCRGLMGNLKMSFTPGEPVRADWDWQGAYQAEPADDAKPTGTYESVRAPTWEGTSNLTLAGSTAFDVSKMEIDLGAVIALRPGGNANTGGIYLAQLTNHFPTVTLDPAAGTYATKNWYTSHFAGTEFNVVAVVGATANNILTITCTNCQISQSPDDSGDRDGVLVDALQLDVHGGVSIAFS